MRRNGPTKFACRRTALALWHVSRLQLALGAAIASAMIDRIFSGSVHLPLIGLIAAGVLTVYTADDLLDARIDEDGNLFLEQWHRARWWWVRIVLPLSLIGVVALLPNLGSRVVLTSATIASAGIVFSIWSSSVWTEPARVSRGRDSLIVSFVWSSAIVLLIALTARAPILHTVLTFSVIWEQTFVMTFLWRTLAGYFGSSSRVALRDSGKLKLLQALCLVSISQIVFGVLLGWFSAAILAAALAPATNLLILNRASRQDWEAWLTLDLVIGFNALCCVPTVLIGPAGQSLLIAT